MKPMLIFLIIVTIIVFLAAIAVLGWILGWRIVEKNTFSEFFVGQVIAVEKGKFPGSIQYIFSYKKRGKPNMVSSRPLWKKRLKNGGLYQIQVFRRGIKGRETVSWAVPVSVFKK